MRRATLLTFAAVAVVAVSVHGGSSLARAEKASPTAVLLRVEAPPTPIGERISVSANLSDPSGEPITDARIKFFLVGELAAVARTDANGTALAHTRRELAAGEYSLTAVFDGLSSRKLEPSSAATNLKITPGSLEVETVPRLAGVEFSLAPTAALTGAESQAYRFASDEDGVARIGIDQAGTYRLEVRPREDQAAGTRAQFSRWSDETFLAGREIVLSSNSRLQVGLDVSYQVSVKFLDLAGRGVDPSRITSVTLTSSAGGRQTLEGSKAAWLLGSRVTRGKNGLEEAKLSYSVENAIVDGSNVVNRGQQRFYPSNSHEWPVQLLLYSAHVSSRDAIFGFPTGSGITLIYPDGHSEERAFGPSAELNLESLPRGDYKVKVNSSGYSPARPVALSKDQVVELKVVSYLDIAVMLLLAGMLALGLFLVGRPHLLRVLRRRTPALTSKPTCRSEGQPPVNMDT